MDHTLIVFSDLLCVTVLLLRCVTSIRSMERIRLSREIKKTEQGVHFKCILNLALPCKFFLCGP